ncbi:YezD family protein [Paenibacillus thermotolerans]|uniref:YezD family protein n=1 Tax=Paenibacillus thermotolerans TaxID=3027807 RepID=UPI002368E1B6|nr:MULTISPECIES: YezD family protein [unclassified Paenibacillus]
MEHFAEGDDVWVERIKDALKNMRFGSVHIIVHEGNIVQIERTERRRYDTERERSQRQK